MEEHDARSSRGITGTIAGAAAITAILLLAALFYATATDRPATYLLGDATSIGGVLPEAGSISEFGIGAWTISAAISAFAAAIFWRSRDHDWSIFFWVTAALLAWFAIDDQYQVHETLVRKYLNIGGSVYVIVYGVAVLGWLWLFRAKLRDGWQILAAAFVALFVTTIADLVNDAGKDDEGSTGPAFGVSVESMNIIEEFSKLLAILLWGGFVVRLAYRRTRDCMIDRQGVSASG
ncbi:MAG: hypothetical protein K0U64_05545 [Actinomycetia bacterium]|nr:hypothetical protein [Actinomycetes bacterium]